LLHISIYKLQVIKEQNDGYNTANIFNLSIAHMQFVELDLGL